MILTTAAVAALKKRYPQAAIDFLVEPPGDEVLAGNPHIRRVLEYRCRSWPGAALWMRRIRKARYDWVIDFMGNPRSAILTAFSGAALRAGPAHAGHRWAYDHPLRQSSTTRYAGMEKILVLEPLGVSADGETGLPELHLGRRPRAPGNRVGLVPSSRRETRRWPAASYARLGSLLKQTYGCEIIVFWGPGERELAESVVSGISAGAVLAPETRSLSELAGLMSGCRLIVSNCNGPKHIAVALGVPTVTIHGSSDPISWNPPHSRHRVARRENLICIGCGLNECPYKMECLRELPPEQVFEEARRLL